MAGKYAKIILILEHQAGPIPETWREKLLDYFALRLAIYKQGYHLVAQAVHITNCNALHNAVLSAVVAEAVAAEREACAAVAEAIAEMWNEQADAEGAHGDYDSAGRSSLLSTLASDVAAAISARASSREEGDE